MVDAPEKIWAGDFDHRGCGHCVDGHRRVSTYEEYVRADIAERENAELRAKVDVQRESKEYAQRCCIKAEARAETAERQLAERDAELARKDKALCYYANPENWIDTPPWDGDPDCITPKAIPIIRGGDDGSPCDCGDAARAALGSGDGGWRE